VHCGLCLSSCPTYLTTGLEAKSPRGRLMIMDKLQSIDGKVDNEIINHLESCLDCRSCETICPSGVDYHSAFQKTVEKYKLNQPKTIISKFILFGIENRAWLSFVSKILIISKKIGLLKILSRFGFATAIQGNSIPVGPILKMKEGLYKTTLKSKGLIGLYTGCIMDEWFNEVHKTTKDVLNKLGYDVLIPEIDMCCGALHSHSGNKKIANELRNKNISYFDDCDFVVINSAGCSAELKSNKNEKVEYLDLIEFLSKQEFKKISKFNKKVVWDAPCHLSHAQKIFNEPLELFKKIGVVPLRWQGQELCCGGAGNYTLNNPKDSSEVLKLKMEQLSNLEFDYLVTSNPGCYLQLEKGRQIYEAKFQVLHFVELIEYMI
jgi:glycolate oxidase iron-sulfur subunit